MAPETKRKRLRLRYQGYSLYLDDTDWQVHFTKVVSWSDRILMDLRGYTGQDPGCDYEIDYLLAHFPLQNIIFWLDKKSNRQQFEQFVKHAIAQHHTGSTDHTCKVRLFDGSLRKRANARLLVANLLYENSGVIL